MSYSKFRRNKQKVVKEDNGKKNKETTLQKPWKQERSRVKYLECLKEKKYQLSICYSVKLSFRTWGIQTFLDKQNWANLLLLPVELSCKKSQKREGSNISQRLRSTKIKVAHQRSNQWRLSKISICRWRLVQNNGKMYKCVYTYV